MPSWRSAGTTASLIPACLVALTVLALDVVTRFLPPILFALFLAAAVVLVGLAIAQVVLGLSVPAPGPARATGAAHGPTVADDVQFTAFRPGSVAVGRWYSLLVVAHRAGEYRDATGAVVRSSVQLEQYAQERLGPQRAAYDFVRQDSRQAIPTGTQLVFKPWLQSGRCNPGQASVAWLESFHPIEFRFLVSRARPGSRLVGGIHVYHGIVLIAEVNFSVVVHDERSIATTGHVVPTPAVRYRKIFASYSHSDAAVVEAVAGFARATGDRYLIDVDLLRAGEVWSDEVGRAIVDADVFQLFWSSNSMRSPFVRREWELALGLGRADFVRPVYWEQPLPADPAWELPPPDLRRLHFAALPVDLVRARPLSAPAGAGSAASGPPAAPAREDSGPPAAPAERRWTALRVVTGVVIALASLSVVGAMFMQVSPLMTYEPARPALRTSLTAAPLEPRPVIVAPPPVPVSPEIDARVLHDRGTTIDVVWTVDPPGPFQYSVRLSSRASATTTRTGAATSARLRVRAGTPYCMQVFAVGPDGMTSESMPVPVRGGSCSG